MLHFRPSVFTFLLFDELLPTCEQVICGFVLQQRVEQFVIFGRECLKSRRFLLEVLSACRMLRCHVCVELLPRCLDSFQNGSKAVEPSFLPSIFTDRFTDRFNDRFGRTGCAVSCDWLRCFWQWLRCFR